MKTGAGEYILGVTRPNGECVQNLVSIPALTKGNKTLECYAVYTSYFPFFTPELEVLLGVVLLSFSHFV